MERVSERGCRLAAHKKTVTACVRVPGANGAREQHVRTFGTTTADLLALRDWLEASGVTPVALESTGVSWKPVVSVLEEAVICVLANAAQIAHVPGRKTDVKDGMGIAHLLAPGLIRGRCVPPGPLRELRDLPRYRTALIQERTRAANRLHKVLEDAGIKLAGGARTCSASRAGPCLTPWWPAPPSRRAWPTGRAAGGARHCPPCAKRSWDDSTDTTPFWSRRSWPTSTTSTRPLGPLRAPIAPVADELARLDTLPGVNQRPAEVLIAELGVDLRVCPTAGPLASWAGLCPGNNESAGTHRSGRPRKGNRWLRSALIEAALAAGTHSTKGACAARDRRVMPQRGPKKAVVAVAHAMLVTAYRLLTHKTTYHDPGADDYDRRHTERARRRAIQALEHQGYRVILEPAA